MQSSLSPDMHPAGLGFHSEYSEGCTLAEAQRVEAARKLRESLAQDAQAENNGSACTIGASHSRVVCINEADHAQFVCGCGFDSGDHLVETAIANMSTHRTLAANEHALNDECSTTSMPVFGGVA